MQKEINQPIKKDQHGLHKVGFILSILCAIHCLALPIIMAFLPSFMQFLHLNLWLELLLIVFIFATGIFVFLKDYKTHRSKNPIIIFAIGLLVVIVNHLAFSNHLNPTNFQIFLNILGGVLLVTAHINNWRLHKKNCNHVH